MRAVFVEMRMKHASENVLDKNPFQFIWEGNYNERQQV